MSRRSKWDQSVQPEENPPEESRGRDKEKKEKKEGGGSGKKTRWSDHASKTFVPGIPTFIPNCLSKQELDALLIRIRIEEIGYKIANNFFDTEYYRSRSPSPTPVYDTLGRRVNTKDQRAKQKLEQERAYLIEKATKINPLFKPPHDYRPSAAKRTKKIYIPVHQFPDYNFIGLIIGPRGLTQKQLEKDTGAKIVIRGKGSVKEGRQGYEEDQDDLHVLITADDTAQIKKAARAVKRLLVPVEEGKNTHKIEQLRKLAEINGTLRDNNAWQPRTWQSADVYCKHCGELSHPTSDCPLKGKPIDKQAIENDYAKFMSEIGLSDSGESKTEAEKTYEQFMASLSGGAPKPQNSAPAARPPVQNQPSAPWKAPAGPSPPQGFQGQPFMGPPHGAPNFMSAPGAPPPWGGHQMPPRGPPGGPPQGGFRGPPPGPYPPHGPPGYFGGPGGPPGGPPGGQYGGAPPGGQFGGQYGGYGGPTGMRGPPAMSGPPGMTGGYSGGPPGASGAPPGSQPAPWR